MGPVKIHFVLLVAGVLGFFASWRGLQAAASEGGGQIQTSYYSTGQVRSEVEYREGKREGVCRRWYADGTLQAQGTYADGKMEGEWSWWLPDGSTDATRSGKYVDDVRTGG